MAIQTEGRIAGRYWNPAGRNVAGTLSGVLNSLSNRQSQSLARDAAKQRMGMLDEQRSAQALVEDMAQVKSLLDANQPTQALEVLRRRKVAGEQLGKDMSNTDDGIRMLLAGDIDGVNAAVDSVLARGQAAGYAPQTGRKTYAPQLVTDAQGNKYYAIPTVQPDGTTEFLPVEMPEGMTPTAETPQERRAKDIAANEQKLRDKWDADLKAQAFADAKDIAKQARTLRSTISGYSRIEKLLEDPNVDINTGPIVRLLPTITAATQELESIGRDIGLDLIAGGKFGPLSEGEMRLAMGQALPDNLPPSELLKWVKKKKGAQLKLAKYLQDLAMKIGRGDITQDEVLELMSAPGIESVYSEDSPPPGVSAAEWQVMTPEERAAF